MQLEQTVQSEFQKLVDNGAVEKIIASKMEKTLNDILEDSLRSYSDFGKKLKDAVSKAVDINLDSLTFIDYNTIVTSIVNEQLSKHFSDAVTKPIDEMIKSYTGTLPKSEYKLSEIIEQFIQSVKSDSDESEGTIDLIVEDSRYGSIVIGFQEHETGTYSKVPSYAADCKYYLYLDEKDKKIFTFQCGRYSPHNDIRQSPQFNGFDGFIFKLAAMKCKVIIDESHCEESWSKYE